MKTTIGVIGGSTCSEQIARLAEEVGRGIANANAVLVCGGRGGVMEAACRGAKSAGGMTIGILPGDDREQANVFVDVAIVTGMGVARNALVVKSSQAVIAIDGKYGTLSEIAFCLQLGIPVVGLQTWEVAPEIITARTPAQAVKLALQAVQRIK
ncbi:TIGR00725 family protein [candidate division KSB1 bacterium]|nr:MAG: TIGR00725 family protein [candidate division KSB1 bacterium]RKY83310.1 MAG: TIGR00725 family protein [candidate division KSB1 bacterium]